MELKQYLEELVKRSPMQGLQILPKLIELEGIENYLNVMFGIELDIKVKISEPKEGRYYGKGIIDSIK